MTVAQKRVLGKIDSILLQIGKFDGTFTSKFTIFSNKTIFIDFHRDEVVIPTKRASKTDR